MISRNDPNFSNPIMNFIKNLFSPSNNEAVTPAEAARRVAAGAAVLIDVREADEWAETGVATPALTLAMSELRGPSEAWKQVLAQNKDREILVYCRSGGRSGRVAETLCAQGFKAVNIGGFSDWAGAGLPVRQVL